MNAAGSERQTNGCLSCCGAFEEHDSGDIRTSHEQQHCQSPEQQRDSAVKLIVQRECALCDRLNHTFAPGVLIAFCSLDGSYTSENSACACATVVVLRKRARIEK